MYLFLNLFPQKRSNPAPIIMGEKTIAFISQLAICLEKETKSLTELSKESKILQSFPVIGTSSVKLTFKTELLVVLLRYCIRPSRLSISPLSLINSFSTVNTSSTEDVSENSVMKRFSVSLITLNLASMSTNSSVTSAELIFSLVTLLPTSLIS